MASCKTIVITQERNNSWLHCWQNNTNGVSEKFLDSKNNLKSNNKIIHGHQEFRLFEHEPPVLLAQPLQ